MPIRLEASNNDAAQASEARKRAVFPLEDRIENATAGKHDNRAVGHGRTPKKEIEP